MTRDQTDVLTGRIVALEEELAVQQREAATARAETEDARRAVGNLRARSDYLAQRERDLMQRLAGSEAEVTRLGAELERAPGRCPCGGLGASAQRDRQALARMADRIALLERSPVVGLPMDDLALVKRFLVVAADEYAHTAAHEALDALGRIRAFLAGEPAAETTGSPA